MGRLSVAVVLIGMTASSGAARGCDTPAGWHPMSAETPGGISAALSLEQMPVVIGQPFTVEVAICAGTDDPVRRVEVDAIMPRHQHGMNYHPSVIQTGPNRYDAANMVFHMPGDWRIRLVAYLTDGVRAFSFDLVVK
jgi:hypothetical protein